MCSGAWGRPWRWRETRRTAAARPLSQTRQLAVKKARDAARAMTNAAIYLKFMESAVDIVMVIYANNSSRNFLNSRSVLLLFVNNSRTRSMYKPWSQMATDIGGQHADENIRTQSIEIRGIDALKAMTLGSGLMPQSPRVACLYPITYEAAYQALNRAASVAEINDILHIAAAMEDFAKKSRDRHLELDAIELRFHAECRLDDFAPVQVNEGAQRPVA
jgi:hypothetical protein